MDRLVLGEATLRRSLDVDSVVVLSSMRMTYFDDNVESRLAVNWSGTSWGHHLHRREII